MVVLLPSWNTCWSGEAPWLWRRISPNFSKWARGDAACAKAMVFGVLAESAKRT
jgi:hypothetical protein